MIVKEREKIDYLIQIEKEKLKIIFKKILTDGNLQENNYSKIY